MCYLKMVLLSQILILSYLALCLFLYTKYDYLRKTPVEDSLWAFTCDPDYLTVFALGAASFIPGVNLFVGFGCLVMILFILMNFYVLPFFIRDHPRDEEFQNSFLSQRVRSGKLKRFLERLSDNE